MKIPKSLNVADIFASIHGELPNQGRPAVIIRLSGCLAVCSYCDAKQYWSQETGQKISLDGILKKIKKAGLKEVLVTGGEPLFQKETLNLLKKLVNAQYRVTLETDGSYSLKGVPKRTTIVMDLKTPGSRSERKTLLPNFKYLKKGDVFKVVLTGKGDYEWAKKFLARHHGRIGCEVVFSPVYGKLKSKSLVELMIKDRSKYRMQIQLHKYLGLK